MVPWPLPSDLKRSDRSVFHVEQSFVIDPFAPTKHTDSRQVRREKQRKEDLARLKGLFPYWSRKQVRRHALNRLS